MAGNTENGAKMYAKYGFERWEMNKKSVAGTVKPYERHVFVCYKSPEAWASHVDNSNADPLPKLIASTAKSRQSEIPIKTKFTVFGWDGSEFSDGDVLIFPDMIVYRGLKESEVDSFMEDVFVGGKPWAARAPQVLTGSHVFVCSHGSRDKRCGVCGPLLIDKLNEEIQVKGLKDQVFVSPCSHTGGHKYAGNMIIFGPDSDGKIAGHWYGYVTPKDVPEIIDQHIGKGEIIQRLWRGQMGTEVSSKKIKESSSNEGNKDSGCCQGADGVSCCRDATSSQQTSTKTATGILGRLSGWMPIGNFGAK